MPAAKDEAGPTWTGVFPKGKIGIMPMASTTLGINDQGPGDRRRAHPRP